MINTDCILWQTQLFVNTLAYFYLKAYLEAKPDILLSFMLLNQLFSLDTTIYRNSNFVFVFSIKLWKNKNNEIGKNFSTAQKQKSVGLIWVFIVLGIKCNFVSSLQKIEEKKEK